MPDMPLLVPSSVRPIAGWVAALLGLFIQRVQAPDRLLRRSSWAEYDQIVPTQQPIRRLDF